MGPFINGSCSSNSQRKGFISSANFPINIEIKTESFETIYQVDPRPFARGKFAQVKRFVHRQTGIEYAGKAIKKRRRSTDVRHEIMHEIGVLLLSRNNEGIVKLHEVYETPSEMILILEMVKGGELQRILDEEDTISEKDSIRLLRQILNSLQFLHDNNIAHLDIKPQNLLLTGPLPDGEVKLCDFGISRLILEGVELREIVGTPDYVAPEILHYEAIRLETDMWSIGVLTYVLLSGYSPFSGDTKQETYSNITNTKLEFGPEFDDISQDAIDFIKSLLVADPKKRPTTKECLNHAWLREDNNVDDLVQVNDNSSVVAVSDPDNGSSSNSSSCDEPPVVNNLPKVVVDSSESDKENQSIIPDGDDNCYNGFRDNNIPNGIVVVTAGNNNNVHNNNNNVIINHNNNAINNNNNNNNTCLDKVPKEKSHDYFILKMTSHSNNSIESKSVPNTPSCKRFMMSEESSTVVRSSSTERRNHSNNNNNNNLSSSTSNTTDKSTSSSSTSILFKSNSSLTSYSSSTTSFESPYHLVFREDIRDERVSFIY